MSIVKIENEVELETITGPAPERSLISQIETRQRELYKEIIGIQNANPRNSNGVIKRTRSFDFDSGLIEGLENDILTLVFRPGIVFRVEKIMATDTFNGQETIIENCTVGTEPQLGFTMSARRSSSFGLFNLDSGLRFDAVTEDKAIAFRIRFLKACTFYMILVGKGIL